MDTISRPNTALFAYAYNTPQFVLYLINADVIHAAVSNAAFGRLQLYRTPKRKSNGEKMKIAETELDVRVSEAAADNPILLGSLTKLEIK